MRLFRESLIAPLLTGLVIAVIVASTGRHHLLTVLWTAVGAAVVALAFTLLVEWKRAWIGTRIHILAKASPIAWRGFRRSPPPEIVPAPLRVRLRALLVRARRLDASLDDPTASVIGSAWVFRHDGVASLIREIRETVASELPEYLHLVETPTATRVGVWSHAANPFLPAAASQAEMREALRRVIDGLAAILREVPL